MMGLFNEQATVMYTYFPKNVPVCDKLDINVILGPTSFLFILRTEL